MNTTKNEQLTEKDSFTAEDVIEKYPKEQRYTLAILQDIQRKYKYISKDSLQFLSNYLNIPLSKLYSMATFYKALSLVPTGKNMITVCDGTACHVAGSMTVLDELKNLLGIHAGETTKDLKFTIRTVNCIGCCAIAPVMMINEKYYGNLTPKMTKEIIDKYRGEE